MSTNKAIKWQWFILGASIAMLSGASLFRTYELAFHGHLGLLVGACVLVVGVLVGAALFCIAVSFFRRGTR